MSKNKTNVTPIIYIIEVINTPKRNIRQVQQIENSLSTFEDKIRRQDLESIISNLLLELNYFLIDKFQNVFRNKTLTKRLSIFKNIDDYKNIVRSFYIWLAFFV